LKLEARQAGLSTSDYPIEAGQVCTHDDNDGDGVGDHGDDDGGDDDDDDDDDDMMIMMI
jgi:hypothetical protein